MTRSAAALDEFVASFHQELLSEADLEGAEQLLPHVFTERMIGELIDAGELDDGEACYYETRGAQVSGYSLEEDEGRLDLFASIFTRSVPPQTVGKSDVETAFRRLLGFLDKATHGLQGGLEEASPAFDMVLRINDARRRLDRVRLFVFTDGRTTIDHRGDENVDGLTVSYHIWDVERLHRTVASGRRFMPIEIDLRERFGAGLPCIAMPESDADYTAYLAIIPGEILNELYAEHGPRLLERNVRSFLQVRGKVNRGIRDTILGEPSRFLAYNNGISATASSVEIAMMDGTPQIVSMKDLQIVNGGQTTASIYNAARGGADISDVYVQAKVTVLSEELIDEIVPLISRYANTQSKVSDADFSANSPFHVRMEELSRRIWAPATDGSQRQTRWFYERARGQYQDALARESTPARKKQFRLQNPPAQKFAKTDLAKFENTWDLRPNIVSLGAQKNFADFTLRLSERPTFEPDEQYFRQLVARAILFRRSERIVSARNFGGYRANIVTYSLALLNHLTAGRIDLEEIWRMQGLPPEIEKAIDHLSVKVHASITDPPRGANVTEWCKRPACWDRIREINADLPPGLHDLLIDTSQPGQRWRRPATGIAAPTPDEVGEIEAAAAVPAETWFEVSRWASQTESLEPWQRGLAYSLGRRANRGQTPTIKQARQGRILLDEAWRRGFRASLD